MARPKEFDENAVLQKAVNLFWEKGFNGVSMQDLIDGLGISRSSLYGTFGDKYQLYLKSLESYNKTYREHFTSVTATSCTAKDGIFGILMTIANDFLADCQHRGCFMVNAGIELASHDAEVNTLVSQCEEQLKQTFYAIIQAGQEDGQISKNKDPKALSSFFNNTVKGLQVAAKSNPDRQSIEEIIKVAITVLE